MVSRNGEEYYHYVQDAIKPDRVKRFYGYKLQLVPCYKEYMMTINEVEFRLEMIKNYKKLLE